MLFWRYHWECENSDNEMPVKKYHLYRSSSDPLSPRVVSNNVQRWCVLGGGYLGLLSAAGEVRVSLGNTILPALTH